MKVKVELRLVVSQTGYQYLKDIAEKMADQLINAIPVNKSDNRSQVGAIYRQAYQRLFAAAERYSAGIPKIQTETARVERYTQELTEL
jgi:phage-related minor tail protein